MGPGEHNGELTITRLRSTDGKVREEATRRLQALEEAEPALRQALTSTDAEVVRRTRSILATFSLRHQMRSLERMNVESKDGPADLLAERIVRWTGPNDEPAIWQATLDFAWRLIDLEAREFKRLHRYGLFSVGFPGRNFAEYARTSQLVYPEPQPGRMEVRPPPDNGYIRGWPLAEKTSSSRSVLPAV